MEAENNHGANGNPQDNTRTKFVGAAPQADDGKDRDGVHDEVEDDVECEKIFVDMPIKLITKAIKPIASSRLNFTSFNHEHCCIKLPKKKKGMQRTRP